MRYIAIGDVHGQYERLCTLLDILVEDERTDAELTRLVFLGDLVDGGPDSRMVVRLVRFLHNADPENVIVLRGNHEQMWMDAVRSHDNRRVFDHWYGQGGHATYLSYAAGLSTFDKAVGGAYSRMKDDFEWVDTLPYKYETESFIFVHAGLNPHAPDATTPDEMMWIRSAFLNSTRDYGKRVICGHTYDETPIVRDNYIKIDTMLHGHGTLTAVWLDDERPDWYEFVSV